MKGRAHTRHIVQSILEMFAHNAILITHNTFTSCMGGSFNNFLVHIDVTVGFERPSYIVDERDGSVVVCLSVIDPADFTLDVFVRVETEDGDAKCMTS